MMFRSAWTGLGRSGRHRLIPSMTCTSDDEASASLTTILWYAGSAIACAAKRAYHVGLPSSARCSVSGQTRQATHVAQIRRLRSLRHHLLAQLFDRYPMPAFDRTDQVGFGAEVVADGGVVALARGLADLPVGHRVDAVLGEQPLGCGQDGLARGAGAIVAQLGRGGHGHSQHRSAG